MLSVHTGRSNTVKKPNTSLISDTVIKPLSIDRMENNNILYQYGRWMDG
jgi:hypothetical protein